jgi:hypothetical protein
MYAKVQQMLQRGHRMRIAIGMISLLGRGCVDDFAKQARCTLTKERSPHAVFLVAGIFQVPAFDYVLADKEMLAEQVFVEDIH